MKKLVLFIILINSSILSFSQYGGGAFFPNPDTLTFSDGVRYLFEGSWEDGYSELPDFNGFPIITQTLTDSLREPGVHDFHFSLSRDYAGFSYHNCIHSPAIDFNYILIGHEDSIGVQYFLSIDSVNWYNYADSAERIAFYQDTEAIIDWDYYHIPHLNSWGQYCNTLVNGEKVFSTNDTIRDLRIDLEAEYTFAGVGAINAIHQHIRLINLSKSPTPGLGITKYETEAAYWCEDLGIGDIEGNLDIELYPNPVNQQTIIDLKNDFNGEVSLQIYEPSGKLIVHNKYCTNKVPLGKLNLREGLYMFVLTNNSGKNARGKFVVEE